MLQGIVHVRLTVTDLDRSVAFYRDVLGLAYLGEMEMEGLQGQSGLSQRQPGTGCAAGGADSICWAGTGTSVRRSVSYLHFGAVLCRRGHRPGVPAS